MKYKIDVSLEYDFVAPTDILLQIEAAATEEQIVEFAEIKVPHADHFVRMHSHDYIGERIWIRKSGLLKVDYHSIIDVNRKDINIETLAAIPPHQLPGDTIQYMLDSTYCPASRFQNFVQDEFGDLSGGERIQAFANWINQKLIYMSGSSNSFTNALDTFVQRRGVCRDFAHLLISLARASSIPARFASVYSVGVKPQDFHAVAEVYLAGAWHIIDPTKMSDSHDAIIIGIGRDAADVGFLTSYGYSIFVNQFVSVEKI